MSKDKIDQNKIAALAKRLGFEFRTTFSLSLKFLKEIFRSKLFIIIAVAMPAILMIFMGAIFGGPLSSVDSYNILVINNDVGYTDGPITYEYGELLIDTLESLTYPVEEGEDPQTIFYVYEVDEYNQSVEDYLLNEDHDLHFTMIIPENFSQVIFSINNEVKITVVGDPATGTYHSAVSIFNTIFNEFVDTAREGLGDDTGQITIVENFIGIAGNTTVFDLMVPGFIIIGIVMNIVFVATVVTEEYEFKTLEKLQLTPMRAIHLIGGLSLSQLLIALVQVIVLLALAFVFGYNAIGSFFVGGFIAWLMSLSMLGIGLIIASFSKKSSIAGSISSVGAIPLYMITFFPVWGIQQIPMFKIGGNVVSVFDILPTNIATRMMIEAMTYGQTFSDLGFEFGLLIIVTLIYLVIGLVLVSIFRLRPKKE
jgi:ABC-2 type transport system permease protein